MSGFFTKVGYAFGRQPAHSEALGLGAYSGSYYTQVIATSSPAILCDTDTPSLHTSTNGISASNTEKTFSSLLLRTNCPALSFLTGRWFHPAKPVTPVTCHGKDIQSPCDQAYRIGNNCPRISDLRLGLVGHLGNLSSQAGCGNRCCLVEVVVDSAHKAAGAVSEGCYDYQINYYFIP